MDWPTKVLDLVLDPIIAIKDNKIVRANQSAHDFLGFNPFELMERGYDGLFRRGSAGIYCRRRDGSEFLVKLRSAVLEDGTIVMALSNETQTNRVEASLEWIAKHTELLGECVERLQSISANDAVLARVVADLARAHQAALDTMS